MRISSTVAKAAATAGALVASTFFAVQALAKDTLSDVSGLSATAGAAGIGATNTDLPTIIGRLIGAALVLLGVVFVILIIYAGFLWMTAQGNDEKVKQAKKVLSGAVIGLVLIFASYAITGFVIDALTNSLGTQGGAQSSTTDSAAYDNCIETCMENGGDANSCPEDCQ